MEPRAAPVVEAQLVGKPCTCGFDDARKGDLVAFIMAFLSADGSFDILCRFWTPLGQSRGDVPASVSFSNSGYALDI